MWEIDRDDRPAIEVSLGEAIVFLNRVGITLEEAYHRRPPIEVEALLLSQIAQREAMREHYRDDIPIYDNPDGEPAPAWVDGLPAEEA